MAMHIMFGLGIGRYWCQIGFYPFSWMVFVQPRDQGAPTNIALGPLRLTFN